MPPYFGTPDDAPDADLEDASFGLPLFTNTDGTMQVRLVARDWYRVKGRDEARAYTVLTRRGELRCGCRARFDGRMCRHASAVLNALTVDFFRQAAIAAVQPLPKLPPAPRRVSTEADAGMLSTCEHLVLSLLVHGYTVAEVAAEIGASDSTVRVHMQALTRKLHANNPFHAGVLAVQQIEGLAATSAGVVASRPVPSTRATSRGRHR